MAWVVTVASMFIHALSVAVLAALQSAPPAPQSPAADLWEAMNLDGGPAPTGTWTAERNDEEEALRCSGAPKGFLASRAHYRTMDLEFEWRWPGEPGNSGLLLFAETVGFVGQPGLVGGWPRNLEVQLQSGDAGHFVTLGPEVSLDVIDPATGLVHEGERIAGIFRRRAIDDIEKPLGEWNQMRVEVGLDQIVVYINGQEVNRGVGGSLTAAHPGGFRPGAFAFQSEGSEIEFRGITVNGNPTNQPRALWNGESTDALAGWTPVGKKGEHVDSEPVIGEFRTTIAYTAPAKDPKEEIAFWFSQESQVSSRKTGALRVNGTPAGYLRTRDAFGARYHLSLEWAWDEGRSGNSGVLLHVTQPDVLNGWPQSMEVQLQSGSAGDFWVIGDDVVDVIVPNMEARRAPKKEGDRHSHRRIRRLDMEESPERPLGQWNRMDVELNGDRIRTFVNGRLVNEGTGLTVRTGAIGLQSEGTPIRFRNVYVR